MSSKGVIVIGGGLAGLSAAVSLATESYRVTLLEKRPFLGGRATSYALADGERIDNCQHITLGCCTNLDDFYRRAGAASRIRYFDRFLFCLPDGRRGTLRSSALPAPLHLALSFLWFPLLTFADKRAIGRALAAITRSAGRPRELEPSRGPITMRAWLERQGQSAAALARFWGPVVASALDEHLDRCDAQYAIDVFWKAFLANRRGYQFGVPTVALADLYEGCRAALMRRGGEVRFRTPVRRIEIQPSGVCGVSVEDQAPLVADHYVSAVPHNLLPALLPPEIAQRPPFANLSELRTAPITGVHLWFDRPVMVEPYLTLLDMTTQWIFNKTALYASGTGTRTPGDQRDGGQYLQLVISASYSLVERPRQQIIEECLAEVRRVLPAAREAQLLKSTVIKEPAATFSPEPGCDRWRPAAKTSVHRLFLAGDWTATGWPATMEGAVRSGYLAAEAILAADGRPKKLVQPDLPVQGLVRFLSRRTRM
jgi:squalene-associated FAD-dependent desaturase